MKTPSIGRPRVDVPTVGKRNRYGRWYVFFNRDGRLYEVALGPISDAEAELRRLEIEVALRTGHWPKWTEDSTAVARYRQRGVAPATDDIVTEYRAILRSEVSRTWADASAASVAELKRFSGVPLDKITPIMADKFLAHVLQSPGPRRAMRDAEGKPTNRTRKTRNNIRMQCGRFYKWAMTRHGFSRNPFEGTRLVRIDEQPTPLFLTAKDRDKLLSAVDADPDALTLWIALYAGLRREEIQRLEWSHLDLSNRLITVVAGKTGKRRTLPMAKALHVRLSAVPKKARKGRLTQWGKANRWDTDADETLARARKVSGLAYDKVLWNTFRHTFASLLVQAGVSIYKVSQWMGNSVDVCTRHYAALSPDADADIDRA